MERRLDVAGGADAAAEFAGNLDRRADRGHSLKVHRMSGLGAVEIDQMEKFRPLFDPTLRLLGGVVGINGFLIVVALPQPDALPAANIHCRYD